MHSQGRNWGGGGGPGALRGGRHDNLVSILCLTECDLPFEKSWLHP